MTKTEDVIRALARTINRKGGLDKVPLSAEALRPMALRLCEFGRTHKHLLIAFDFSKGAPTDIYLGFIVPIWEAPKIATAITDDLTAAGLMDLARGAKANMDLLGNGMAALYFDKLFIPAAALDGQKH